MFRVCVCASHTLYTNSVCISLSLHTHTHTLSLSLTHTHSHACMHSCNYSQKVYSAHTHTLSRALSPFLLSLAPFSRARSLTHTCMHRCDYRGACRHA